MKREIYVEIKRFLRGVIKGTEFEGHVMAVGGCVRDDLMGNEIKDIDMCVSLPSGGIRFAQWLRDSGYALKDVTVYPNYGTAMLHLKAFPDVELEFVQTRKEKYIDHSCRNPETSFGTIEEDCMRRDLTINALYCNLSTDEIVDITGNGVNDIHNHIIRTPSDPDLTYDDDPLRVLRCIRFASRYGWKIDKDTFDGMVRNVFRLEIITKERVHDEFCKMLTSMYPVLALNLLKETGAMHYVIPELEKTYEMTPDTCHFATVWKYILAVLENVHGNKELRQDKEALSVLCMAALLIRCPTHLPENCDMIEGIMRRLKFSNNEIDEVRFLVLHAADCESWGTRCEQMEDRNLRSLQYLCKTEDRFNRLMMLVHAANMARSSPDQVPVILARTAKMKAEGTAMFGFKGFLTGNEVMKIKGLKPGPQVKDCLAYLLDIAFSDPLMDRKLVIKKLMDYESEF